MRLTETTVNTIVDDLAERLNGGTLRIYDQIPSGTFVEGPLVALDLRSPAFALAKEGKTTALGLEPTRITRTGEASYGELVTASGEVVATLTVAKRDDANAQDADVLADRTDFHRGGLCTVASIVLRLPLGS